MRVLIATVTAGGGHLAAAAALEESWKKMHPADVVECVDVLKFAAKLQRKLYTETYVKIIEHAPELYALLFKKTDNHEHLRKISRFRRTFARGTNTGFIRHLKSFKPDVVLCTHYLPLEILCHPKDALKREVLSRCALSPILKRTPFGSNHRLIFIALLPKKRWKASSREERAARTLPSREFQSLRSSPRQ